MTQRQIAYGAAGEQNGICLKLTDEDARACAEYQLMLKQLSSKSSEGSDALAPLRKLRRRGGASVTGARRPCRVISL